MQQKQMHKESCHLMNVRTTSRQQTGAEPSWASYMLYIIACLIWSL